MKYQENTSRYFGVAGQGSPNSPELISMLQDWLPSHLQTMIVKVNRMVKMIMMIKMMRMIRMTMMIMTRKWGK